MTEVYRKLIDHPAAWTAAEIGGRSGLEYRTPPAVLDALREDLVRTGGKAVTATTQGDFDCPPLRDMMDSVSRTIRDGRGAVLITGIAPSDFSEEEMQRIYWAMGTFLGAPAVQSQHGDLIGSVQSADSDPHQRGYRSSLELNMHTDSYEIVGLMSVRTAAEGGISGLVSGLAVHNEILRTRPDLLASLYEGYFYASEEAQFSDQPVTAEKVPVFTCVGDSVSCAFEKGQMVAAARRLGVPFPPAIEEAVDYFRELCNRPDLALKFVLQPGEILLWNNFVMLHSRTAYRNRPGAPRLLWRLWLTPPENLRRQIDPAVLIRARTYERLHRESMATGGRANLNQ